MTIKCADSAGFCFGVKRAVDTVYDLLAKENHKVYTLGPIIHNEQVVEDLASQGVQVIEHPDEIAKEDRSQAILVIRSHVYRNPSSTRSRRKKFHLRMQRVHL